MVTVQQYNGKAWQYGDDNNYTTVRWRIVTIVLSPSYCHASSSHCHFRIVTIVLSHIAIVLSRTVKIALRDFWSKRKRDSPKRKHHKYSHISVTQTQKFEYIVTIVVLTSYNFSDVLIKIWKAGDDMPLGICYLNHAICYLPLAICDLLFALRR
jgi:hypothetical protein